MSIFFTNLHFWAIYPFEKFKSPKYATLKLTKVEDPNSITYSANAVSFFNDKSNLEITLNGNFENLKENNIYLKFNSNSKKYYEEILFQGIKGIYIADINGDGKKDIKIVCDYMGNGLAALNVRVMYFFQKENKEFTKVAFDDKMDGNRLERDLNNDGNFEIVTMILQYHIKHNYWLFNVYNFVNDNLILVNNKVNYPIMIQHLYRDNYKVSTSISKAQIKNYQLNLPEGLSIDK